MDNIIIGGSLAGLAAPLQLGRARREVTVLDTGLRRNRFARHSHGLLGHDHKSSLDTRLCAQRKQGYRSERTHHVRAPKVRASHVAMISTTPTGVAPSSPAAAYRWTSA